MRTWRRSLSGWQGHELLSKVKKVEAVICPGIGCAFSVNAQIASRLAAGGSFHIVELFVLALTACQFVKGCFMCDIVYQRYR
ncbi:hypothetical protein CXK92_00515 [Stutzerimonas stutzeri]|uniref:Uncharacterized protein n=1 Tax=Stutzerimonas stutzeri TaxID=316 RepID=A0A2N8S5U5_STUST|nr:hypothetical protein CXK92_00515 [Stutzerimonas stutzeri]